MGFRYPFRENNGYVKPKQAGDRGRSVVVTEACRRSGSQIVEKPRLSKVSDQTNDIHTLNIMAAKDSEKHGSTQITMTFDAEECGL